MAKRKPRTKPEQAMIEQTEQNGDDLDLLLTPDAVRARVERFIWGWLTTGNQAEGARLAGYSTKSARFQGVRLANKCKPGGQFYELAKTIAAKIAAKDGVTKQWLLDRLNRLASADIGNYVEQVAIMDENGGVVGHTYRLQDLTGVDTYGIDSIKIRKGGEIAGLKLADRHTALRTLADVLGITAPQQVQVSGQIGLIPLNESDERRAAWGLPEPDGNEEG